MNFLTVSGGCTPVSERPIEIVERKGIGHPDTLADGIAESISIAYSKYCLEHFGAVLHHNVDKIALGGGSFVSTEFGRAEMISPIRVTLNGRMSSSFGGQAIDVAAIQEEAVRAYLSQVLPELNVQDHLSFEHRTTDYARYDTWFRPRSLEDLPELKSLAAADASICVGYWPLTPTEQLTLALEHHLNDLSLPRKYRFVGQDVKVLSLRRGSEVEVLMSIPFLSRFTPDRDFYEDMKSRLRDDLLSVADKLLGGEYSIQLHINTQEQAPFKAKRVYMLAIGSCVECGEEGVVGRGNPPVGVISTHRPHSVEAPYGKNPVYHSGKVYSYLASRLARAVSEEFGCASTVYAISRNGSALLPPPRLLVEVSATAINHQRLHNLIDEHFMEANYLSAILAEGALLPK